MSSTASVGGLISGLDTNSMLDQLYELAQAPVRRLQARQVQLNAQSAAWAQLEARLLSLRTSALPLLQTPAFNAQQASVSRPDLASATASSSAVSGSYLFSVEKLALSHQVVSQGYADTDQTEVGSGTISIQVGDGDATVVAVEGFTLAELRDAINAADAGAKATIINEGTGAAPYRLIITSQTSGLAGSMTIQTSLAGGTPPTFGDLQQAQDAEIKLGSGAGAVTISSGTNRVTGAIQGVTLDLLKADPGAPVTVTLSRNVSGIQSQVAALVDAYNTLVDFFAEQFHYDPETAESGTLFANYQLQSVQQALGAAITGQVLGLSGAPRALVDVGVRALSSGRLSLDSGAFAVALASKPDQVAQVFAALGRPSHADVVYLSSTVDTQPSGAAGWEVQITQAAAQARLTAGVAQTSPLAADETLTIRAIPISLSAGMTQEEVVSAINAQSAQTGVLASATGAGGTGVGTYLTLTRVAYGSAQHADAVSTASNQGGEDTSGMGAIAVSDESPAGEGGLGAGALGKDVQGTIGGEAATGSGQILTGAAGSPKGLALLVKATAPGSYGSVVFTVGAAEAAFRVALSATDATSGTVATAQTSIADLIANMDEQIGRLQASADREIQRMRTAFARMETALGRFQAQNQYLAGQISQMQLSAAAASRQ